MVDVITEGIKARLLLEDDTLKTAFENVRLAILKKIESAPIRDREGVHELRLCLKLLRDVRANLEQAVSDGKLEEYRLKEESRLKSVLNRWRKAS